MYDLSYKKVEDIVVGDKLMGNDSSPKNVLKLCRGKSQLYKVKQKKGLDYIVNNEHILITEDQGKDIRKTINGKRIYVGRKHTDGLFKFKAEDFYNNSWKSTTKQYKGIKTGLEFKEKKVELDPYYLGLWLGDGCSRTASITNVDKEVLDYLFDEIPKIYDVFVAKQDKVSTKIIKNKGKYNDIIQRLKYYNLILNKHIPKEYIKNNRKIRLELLAGLIDSDGCLTKDSQTKKAKGYTIVQKRKQLSDDILLLCRTLGLYCTQYKRISKMKREDGSIYECDTWTVSIFMKDYSELPVKIKRKQYNLVNSKNPLRSTIELEKLNIVNYYGFELDGNHLFLLEDFTITHNTSASKTISILIWLIDRGQSTTNEVMTVVAESVPHLKLGAVRDFKNIMIAQGYWDDNAWNASNFTYTFPDKSILEFISFDKFGKAHGPRRDILFVNEANNLPYNIVDQLITRTKKIVWMDWNPTSEFWFYTEMLNKRDDIDFITLTYKDCLNALEQTIIDEIESHKHNASWWKVYGLGQLGEIEGLIYKGWRILDEVPFEARLEKRWLDFGYTNDPSAGGDIYYYNGGWILDELFYRKGMSNKQLADYYNALEKSETTIVADSAEPKSIDELGAYGLNVVPSKKGKDSVVSGIQLVQDQPISVTRRSFNILKEQRNYMWLVDKNGKTLNEEDPKCANHHMAGIRYALTTLGRLKQEKDYWDKVFEDELTNKPIRNNFDKGK